MIYIDDDYPRKIDPDTFTDAVDWVYNRLNMDVDVSIGFDTNRGFSGDVGIEDSEISILISRQIGTKTAIVTIFHEMVHAKQIADGQLTYDSADRLLWLGERFDGVYAESPWEKEAWLMEKVLLDEYMAYVHSSADVVV